MDWRYCVFNGRDLNEQLLELSEGVKELKLTNESAEELKQHQESLVNQSQSNIKYLVQNVSRVADNMQTLLLKSLGPVRYLFFKK